MTKAFVLIAAVFATGVGCAQEQPDEARLRMVQDQIAARGVQDTATLCAMSTVPRHLFVPEQLARRAYEDTPLPIGLDQTISQPYIVALMTELIKPHREQRVLEVGTGSGYQAAVLAEIVDSVFTIEILPDLARSRRGDGHPRRPAGAGTGAHAGEERGERRGDTIADPGPIRAAHAHTLITCDRFGEQGVMESIWMIAKGLSHRWIRWVQR